MLCHITPEKSRCGRSASPFTRNIPKCGGCSQSLRSRQIRVGFKSYSAAVIFEVIRHMKNMGGDGVTCFKLNNNYRAFYARAFHKKFPQHEGFFRTRKQTSSDQDASRLGPLTPADYS